MPGFLPLVELLQSLLDDGAVCSDCSMEEDSSTNENVGAIGDVSDTGPKLVSIGSCPLTGVEVRGSHMDADEFELNDF